MLVLNDLLRIFPRHVYKKISSKVVDLDIENPLGRGTLAKFRATMYLNMLALI
jgi:hypothetical protein